MKTFLFTVLFFVASSRPKSRLEEAAKRLTRKAWREAYKAGFKGDERLEIILKDYQMSFTAEADSIAEEIQNQQAEAQGDFERVKEALENLDKNAEIDKFFRSYTEERQEEQEPHVNRIAEIGVEKEFSQDNLAEAETQLEDYLEHNPEKRNAKKGLIYFAVVTYIVIHQVIETGLIQAAFSETDLFNNAISWVISIGITLLVILSYFEFGRWYHDGKMKRAIAILTVPLLASALIFYLRFQYLSQKELLGLVGISLLFILSGIFLSLKYFENKKVFDLQKEVIKARSKIKKLATEEALETQKVVDINNKFLDLAKDDLDYHIKDLKQKEVDSEKQIKSCAAILPGLQVQKKDLIEKGEARIRNAYAKGQAANVLRFSIILIAMMFTFFASSCKSIGSEPEEIYIAIDIDHSQSPDSLGLPDVLSVVNYINEISGFDSEPFGAKTVSVRISSIGNVSMRRTEVIDFEYAGYFASKGPDYERKAEAFNNSLEKSLNDFYKNIDTESQTMVYSAMCHSLNWLDGKSNKSHYLLLSDAIESSRLIDFEEFHQEDNQWYEHHYEKIDSIFSNHCTMGVDFSDISIVGVNLPDYQHDELCHASQEFWRRFLGSKKAQIQFLPNL